MQACTPPGGPAAASLLDELAPSSSPVAGVQQLAPARCQPCHGGTSMLAAGSTHTYIGSDQPSVCVGWWVRGMLWGDVGPLRGASTCGLCGAGVGAAAGVLGVGDQAARRGVGAAASGAVSRWFGCTLLFLPMWWGIICLLGFWVLFVFLGGFLGLMLDPGVKAWFN